MISGALTLGIDWVLHRLEPFLLGIGNNRYGRPQAKTDPSAAITAGRKAP